LNQNRNSDIVGALIKINFKTSNSTGSLYAFGVLMYIDDLLPETQSFFDLHWVEGVEVPVWKYKWDWNSSLPNCNLGGVYALLDGDGEIVYIGLGASAKGSGLSVRIVSHVIKNNPDKTPEYIPQEKWEDIQDIATIGFPLEYQYMALALEDYLINKLKPKRNMRKK
jgi:hypothetical protein